jgi:hypothetical protein
MRTVSTFESNSFNTSEGKDYFINPNCFGDDLCIWLMRRLQDAGVQTDSEPGQEDFGWYFNLTLPEGGHCCVVGFRPGEAAHPGMWIAWLERRCGLIGSVLGARNRGIASSAVSAIHRALSGAPEIHNVRWHVKKDFDQGNEELGSPTP